MAASSVLVGNSLAVRYKVGVDAKGKGNDSKNCHGTQVSVINYSGLVDGKKAIILSALDSTTSRRNAEVWIGLINDTGSA